LPSKAPRMFRVSSLLMQDLGEHQNEKELAMPGAPDLSVPVRLTSSEMWLISFGLGKVERDYKIWQKYGPSRFMYEASAPVPTPDTKDIVEQMAVIVKVLDILCVKSQATKRLHLDAIELAACALGARITCLWARKRKGAKWKRRNHQATINNLQLKLENERKTAKRLHIRVHGMEHYRAARGRWRRHVEWIRKVFAYAFWLRTKIEPYHRIKMRRMVIMDWVKWV
jgi:hypothetical protein